MRLHPIARRAALVASIIVGLAILTIIGTYIHYYIHPEKGTDVFAGFLIALIIILDGYVIYLITSVLYNYIVHGKF